MNKEAFERKMWKEINELKVDTITFGKRPRKRNIRNLEKLRKIATDNDWQAYEIFIRGELKNYK